MRIILIVSVLTTALLDFTANLLAATFIHVGPLSTAVGTLTFALSYTLYDYIRRYHGRAATIWAVVAGAGGTLAYSFLFDGGLGRIVLASLVALSIASAIDIRMQTRLLAGPIWRLVLFSNGVSLMFDTVIFTLIAFLGVEGIPIPGLIAGDYLTKLAMSLASLPLIYGVAMIVPYRPLTAAAAR